MTQRPLSQRQRARGRRSDSLRNEAVSRGDQAPGSQDFCCDPWRKPSATFYIPEALQARGRAAFRHTQILEGDESYSHMVAKAYEAEVRRRRPFTTAGSRSAGEGHYLPVAPSRDK